jgi:hypothetical protein
MTSNSERRIEQTGIKCRGRVEGCKLVVTQVVGEESIGNVKDTKTEIARKKGYVKQTAI